MRPVMPPREINDAEGAGVERRPAADAASGLRYMNFSFFGDRLGREPFVTRTFFREHHCGAERTALRTSGLSPRADVKASPPLAGRSAWSRPDCAFRDYKPCRSGQLPVTNARTAVSSRAPDLERAGCRPSGSSCRRDKSTSPASRPGGAGTSGVRLLEEAYASMVRDFTARRGDGWCSRLPHDGRWHARPHSAAFRLASVAVST